MDSHNGEADDLPPPPPLNACIEPLKSGNKEAVET